MSVDRDRIRSILIGGPGRAGKTILANRLHELTGCSVIGLDSVFDGINSAVNSNPDWSEVDAKKLTRAIVPGLLVSLLFHRRAHILEGSWISPALAAGHVNGTDIRAVFIGYPTCDPQTKLAEIQAAARHAHNWLERTSDEFRQDFIAGQIRYSRRLQEECAELEIPFVDVSRDFDQSIDRAVTAVLGLQTSR